MGEFIGVLWTAVKLLRTVGRDMWIFEGGEFMTVQKPWCPDIKTTMIAQQDKGLYELRFEDRNFQIQARNHLINTPTNTHMYYLKF